MPANGATDKSRLDSWKAIAAYLDRDVRTVMRWEKDRGLPVHRIPGKRSGVYAIAPEVDGWLKTGRNQHDGQSENIIETEQSRSPSRVIILWAAVASAVVLALLALTFSEPRRVPALHNPLRITNDGIWKSGNLIVHDGFVYYVGKRDGLWTLMKTSVGYPSQTVSLPFSAVSLSLESLSPSGSEFILLRSDSPSGPWFSVIASIANRSVRALTPPRQYTASSPDAALVAYNAEGGVYLANQDGTRPRKIGDVPYGRPSSMLSWAPDGKHLRFAVEGIPTAASSLLWEMSTAGSRAARVLPGWSRGPHDKERVGNWMPRGDFYVFAGVHDGVNGLWAIPEDRSWLKHRATVPIPLITTTRAPTYCTPSPDGKKLYAIVTSEPRGELMRYERKVNEFVIYAGFPGSSAGHVAFSPDGRSAAYIAFPEEGLWRMNADGTNRQQLAGAPLKASLPQWSPDGKQIAFMACTKEDARTKIRVIGAGGGIPEMPVTWPGWQGVPVWTADGSALVFGENGDHYPIRASCCLHRFDFKSGKTTDLPGTTGLWTARTCPTGRYIAAETRDQRKLVLYDMRTGRISELAAFPDSSVGDNPSWSRDGKFIYIDAPKSKEPAIYRISLADRTKERIASLKGMPRAPMGDWIGLAPDGSLLVTRLLESAEIWAWDWVLR